MAPTLEELAGKSIVSPLHKRWVSKALLKGGPETQI
jgi:hypothetical protein